MAMTIVLTLILTMLGATILAKMVVSMKDASRAKERQNTMDAAMVGLNMAIDDISPGLEKMRNSVWSRGALDARTVTTYVVQPMLTASGATTSESVRELALLGNIRNWEAFADWSKPYGSAGWDKGWQYLKDDAGTLYFDSAGKRPIKVGNKATDGAYWYKQLNPQPPTKANGAPDIPSTAPNSPIWKNASEYPKGIFYQPILYKTYDVRQNPKVRVTVFVRMSLHDYFQYDPTSQKYLNINPDSKYFNDPTTTTFNGANFRDSNAITFSVFAVSEETAISRGVRIHQALNVAVGGMEYMSGLGAGAWARGLENPARLTDGGAPPGNYSAPYFAPTLDTPSGNNRLIANTQITGQVFPANTDLSLDFTTRPATEQVAFLYETITYNRTSPGRSNPDTVIFLIERMPFDSQTYWRRRLLFDFPHGFGASPIGAESWWAPVGFKNASYSIDPWAHDADFPSTYWWASIPQASGGAADIQVVNKKEEHFSTPSFSINSTTTMRYPFSAILSEVGTFSIGTRGALDKTRRGNVINWPTNPLRAKNGNPLPAEMPWEGPTVVMPGVDATVSYTVTTWPYHAYSAMWDVRGGSIGFEYPAATWSIR
ncbi:hypothetical protein J7643_14580 [bacterium]|nr:hypothetical protein [bacterium]